MLDRCILEETKRDIDLRHEEELARLRVEFQLEGSVTRKKLREVRFVCLCVCGCAGVCVRLCEGEGEGEGERERESERE